ncbi:equilibrative nucleoside transporter 2-like [Erpetoichthys calabaricus]|uniref:Solute carrier family 29 member 2 n=1 Tax=Erpetoichthys calabaricus TaxID=27687 RepID=A0A8C4X2V5_ERPCA|nr:equilibrative nucleoside transporter 2-like [Erpetoichthys calabaricus]XP_028658866.1 equilibrative nucleoside transporter 2-like [Erpetoichthys calabaricus]XP_028658874.1 equilibrative nucleoside transporter 2-like [Erpetoichthys calabaricus]
MGQKDAPKDRFHLVGVIFFIQGLGTLLPWNFFITAIGYFNERLRSNFVHPSYNSTNVTHSAEHDEYHFGNWMTLLAQLPLLLFTLLNSFLYQWISERIRIAGSLLCILLCFILTAAFVKIDMEPGTFFSVTMATIWFINSFGAVLQGSLFGLVGLLPQKYSTLFMSGQGLAGIFAALAMLIALSLGTDTRTAALGYFITPCIGTLISVFTYLMLPHLEFSSYYLNRNHKLHELETKDHLLQTENGKENGHANGGKQAYLALDQTENGEVNTQKKSSVFQVLKKIKMMAFCITLVFTVSLSVFPAVTADVKSQFGDPWNKYFIPVCCFLAFNLMDWAGRSVTVCVRWPSKNSCFFPLLVCARIVFIPLLMLCNVQERTYLPVIFHHDAVFVILMALFSFTSGYCACLSMSYAPQMVEPQDVETTGALMTFFLALGLSLGGALSFLLRMIV